MNDQATNLNKATGGLNLSPDQVTGRLTLFCDWFGVEQVKLKVRKGKVYLSDDLLAWCSDNEVSIDWLLCGDIRPVMAAFRSQGLNRRRVEKLLERCRDEAARTALA